MHRRLTPWLMLFSLFCVPATAQESETPPELKVIEESIGVWDAEIEVWPEGLDKPSVKFKGVETNRAYGKHWLASDFDSEFQGQTMRVHSIVGYDLDRKQLVGFNVDHGPYAAKLTGTYDAESRTIHWDTEAKDEAGKPLTQKTTVVHRSATERILVLSAPNGDGDKFEKVMEIRFLKRQE